MEIQLNIAASQVRRMSVDAPEGVKVITPNGIEGRRDASGFDPLTLVFISSTLSVPAGLIIIWLNKHFSKNPPQNITINRTKIDYYKSGEVKRIIEEEITKEEKGE
jgi:hypothetical protein